MHGKDYDQEGLEYETHDDQFKTFAWTSINLFNQRQSLIEGAYWVPLYYPPTKLDARYTEMLKHKRMKFPQMYLRVMRPEPNRFSAIIGNPSYKNAYVKCNIHDAKGPRMEEHMPKGIAIAVHSIKGYKPDNHVRIACAIQMGQDILMQDTGQLCFFVTKGVMPDGSNANVGGAVTLGNAPSTSRT